ncbi:hypothetical protein BDP55DRAFT_634768 [Colletotrichum godetiae]|uniref:Uncharacterized protein n=1 Tax=Colletotrichum godetiae TaxID=1209918 RepID=A0AAJ0AHL0_9PEZI|nr:uncharacterized protein BDP55DRAFT_634768 [Colletotrichum godetiae]KAK1672497.1 hypothetical protein BDP55DRAFT_634768 [Colletotrichum godetiae]
MLEFGGRNRRVIDNIEQPPAAYRTPLRKPAWKTHDPKCPYSEAIQSRKTLHKHKRHLVSGFYGFPATRYDCTARLKIDDCDVFSGCEGCYQSSGKPGLKRTLLVHHETMECFLLPVVFSAGRGTSLATNILNFRRNRPIVDSLKAAAMIVVGATRQTMRR